MEMFEGSAAQFLAVLESLTVSSRRPLQTGIPDEPEIQEVALELMSAGISLLSGIISTYVNQNCLLEYDILTFDVVCAVGKGGSSDRVPNDGLPLSLNAIALSVTLMQKAIAGKLFVYSFIFYYCLEILHTKLI